MDIFAYADKVRIRSSHTGKYLAAHPSNKSVLQARKTGFATKDEALEWDVKQFRTGNNSKPMLRFRSTYGGYLTGSHHNFLLGWTGKKVIQTNPTKADDLSEWQPIQHAGTLIRLRTAEGTYLRANGGTPPWRNSVTHDDQSSGGGDDDDGNLVWEVEIVSEKDYSKIPVD